MPNSVTLGNTRYYYRYNDNGDVEVINTATLTSVDKDREYLDNLCKGTCGVIVCKDCMADLDNVLDF